MRHLIRAMKRHGLINKKTMTKTKTNTMAMTIRAGPQSQKWSDQQITLNPTGSIHKKARKKKFDPKKVDFD